MKTCTHCNKPYPATTEYFYQRGNRLRPLCKKCEAAEKKNRYVKKQRDDIDLTGLYLVHSWMEWVFGIAHGNRHGQFLVAQTIITVIGQFVLERRGV